MVINISGGNQLLDSPKILKELGVKEGWKVADLGCGAVGYFVFPAVKMVGKEGVVYAVDIRKLVLAGIKNRARIDGIDNIYAIWSNLEVPKATGILDNSLDLAMLINVLFQNKKREEILAEAIRMVKSGSHLAVIDWKKQKSALGPPLESRVNIEAVIKFCQENGLTVEEEFEAGKFHFGLLFKKT